MSLTLHVLGSSSAIPAHGRGLSAQVLQTASQNYLIDCGEGTQFRLVENRIRISRINQIFISHLHGDHLFGLPGLLSTMSMQGRTKKLIIYGPDGLSSILDTIFDFTETHLGFNLEYRRVVTDKYQVLFSNDEMKVYAIPLDHRITAFGYKFVEKTKRNILPETINKYKLEFNQIKLLKAGKDIKLNSGELLTSEGHTWAKRQALSFAYLSDTTFRPELADKVRGVDILFHEATYMDDLSHLAKERKHSTALQAAKLARNAQVKKLVLGHFSSRYKDLEPLLNEARTIFAETYLGVDGTRFNF